ncbi:MAG: D-arabitol-phosphate dehydrogenase [Candidatus Moanabacter tarae]|uniref:D-arabitol-phosphate dehydrogenase n=1 Tax=Candidatus Moanibacter tarae TaxID=2200854 RepID=A0A2Z4AH38_9BACT|nr:MAG: D-arabitol-phosphate dehydrogenase [Candidatus Moanabacter tarae]|tara:strand:+ start:6501 stop:7499 length:999 start_codon:yes stop_codon:yes gene_type:complete
MKIAAIIGEREAELVEMPDPVPVGEFVLIKIHRVPMCTEYKGYLKGNKNDNLGHEAVGEVVDMAQPGNVAIGDRVVLQCGSGCGQCALCYSGEHIHCLNWSWPGIQNPRFAQYALQKDWLCSKIPDDISYDHAGLALCGLGPSLGAMNQIGVEATDIVLITGLGPVGLGGVINASHRGARVIAVESLPYRANLGKELGAEEVFDPSDLDILKKIKELTGGEGVDKALDFSGAAQAQRLMLDATKRRGEVAFVGEGGEVPLVVSSDMIRKGLVLRGNWHYNISDFPQLVRVIQTSKGKLDRLITHHFPMSEVRDAFELQSTGECGKVLLDPWA